jgi:hypothetical protein
MESIRGVGASASLKLAEDCLLVLVQEAIRGACASASLKRLLRKHQLRDTSLHRGRTRLGLIEASSALISDGPCPFIDFEAYPT